MEKSDSESYFSFFLALFPQQLTRSLASSRLRVYGRGRGSNALRGRSAEFALLKQSLYNLFLAFLHCISPQSTFYLASSEAERAVKKRKRAMLKNVKKAKNVLFLVFSFPISHTTHTQPCIE